MMNINSMLTILTRLAEFSNHNGELVIRHRDMVLSLDSESEKSDYLVSLGDIKVDVPVATIIADRRSSPLSDLPGKLTDAFGFLASIPINNLHLAISLQNSEDEQKLKTSLRLLQRYFMVAGKKDAGSLQGGENNDIPDIVRNENGHPDPNLTLLAGLNGLDNETIQALINKVQSMMGTPELEEQTSVYSAIFSFDQLSKQLVKPPWEINNVLWLAGENDQNAVSKEKAKLIRTLNGNVGRFTSEYGSGYAGSLWR